MERFFDDLKRRAAELGFEGEEMRQWVKQQHDVERDFRVKERAHTRKKEMKEMEMAEKKLEHEEKEREYEREKEMKRLDHERKMELKLLELKFEHERLDIEAKKTDSNAVKEKIILPIFNEERDKFDTFICKFESYAKLMKWPRTDWAMQLSLVLTGQTSDIFYSLPEEHQRDYDKVKNALLRKFSLTEEGLRKELFATTAKTTESPLLFMTRLDRTFQQWVDAAKITKSYDGLKNLLLREEFLKRCHNDLVSYVREKAKSEIMDIADISQHYIDAYGGSISSKMSRKSDGVKDTTESVEVMRCGICGKLGHLEVRCWYQEEQNDSKNTRNGGKEEQMNNNGNCKTMASSAITYSMVSNESCDRKDKRKGEYKSKNRRNILNRFECDNRTEHMERNYNKAGNLGHPRRPPAEIHKHFASKRYNDNMKQQAEKMTKCMNVPITEGRINGWPGFVLRDSGFSKAAVRMQYVRPEQYTNEYEHLILMDGTYRKFPKAKLFVDTPYHNGELEAIVIDNPVADLIIGNVEHMELN